MYKESKNYRNTSKKMVKQSNRAAQLLPVITRTDKADALVLEISWLTPLAEVLEDVKFVIFDVGVLLPGTC